MMNWCQQRTSPRLNSVIKNYLKKHNLLDENPGWEIRLSDSSGGFGVFVTRDFDAGEIIFKDFPIIIGPRCIPNCSKVCIQCFSKENLQACSKGCGLKLCADVNNNNPCENSKNHLKECKLLRQHHKRTDLCTIINNNHNNEDDDEDFEKKLYENFTPLKGLLLDDDDKAVISCLIAHDREEHGHEIDLLKNKLGFQFKENDEEEFLRFICRVLDANAFEVALGNEESQSSVRGLYPLGSLANHSCVPNTMHVFNKEREMVVKAAVFIPKNAEIFHSYTRIIWGSGTRLYHLHQTKHFICKCARCKDVTEFGTFMGSVLCKLCRGITSPKNPYKHYGKWECWDCKNITTGKETGHLITMLGSILRNIKYDDFQFMWKFLNGKLKSVVPDTNQVAVELKYKIVWVIGYKPGYLWNEVTIEQIKIKEKICEELLELLEKLRCGQNKMRGLLLYELFCCKRATINRINSSKENNISPEDIQNLLTEAASILEYDVTAPEELKRK